MALEMFVESWELWSESEAGKASMSSVYAHGHTC